MSKYDLISPDYVANPYPTYQRLLAEDPIYYCPERQFYYVSRYEYVKRIFRDPKASSNRIKAMANSIPEALQQFAASLIESLEKWVLFLDPPVHTEIRRAINPAFSPKVIRLLEPKIETIAKDLLASMSQQPTPDLVAHYAYPLPVMVIAELLGCPSEDRELLKRWSDDIATFLGNKTTLESANKARTSIIEATEYFADILKMHRTSRCHNLLQNLIDYQATNPEFSDEHLIANAIALIFAGHETTTNLIANTAYNLLSHAEIWNRGVELVDDAYWQSCIEESLRFESPVQRMGRFSVDTIDIDGIKIEPGRRILLLLGAANRDERIFKNPNVYDPERKNKEHIAFGFGHHFCSGATLARLEALVALRALSHAYPTLSYSNLKAESLKSEFLKPESFKPEWQYNLGLRALQCFPIALG